MEATLRAEASSAATTVASTTLGVKSPELLSYAGALPRWHRRRGTAPSPTH